MGSIKTKISHCNTHGYSTDEHNSLLKTVLNTAYTVYTTMPSLSELLTIGL